MGIWVILKLLMLETVLFKESSPTPQKLVEKQRLVQGEASSVYNFPFMCSYHFTPRRGRHFVLGTCTIYSRDIVLIAIDTVERLISYTQYFWFQQFTEISIIAGSDILDPADPESQQYVQTRKVRKFTVGLREDMGSYPTIVNNPKRFTKDYERNKLGELACDIGLFYVDRPWDWNPVVLPVPLPTLNYENMDELSKDWNQRLEEWPWLYDTCTVAGWGPTGNNELMVHELVFVSMNECMESMCVHHGETCLQYPVPGHHVCFKARNYGDVCIYDQGSPVFCPWFGRGVFAVLSRAFDCGLENMPAVYTLMSYITTFTKIVDEGDRRIEPRPDYNDPRYIIPDSPPSTRPTTARTRATTRPTRRTTRRRTTRRTTRRRRPR